MGLFFSFFIEDAMTLFKFNQCLNGLNIFKLHNVIGENGFLKKIKISFKHFN